MEVVELIDAAVSLYKPQTERRVAPALADTKSDFHVHHTNYYLRKQMKALRDWSLI
jgi:hypothetical protein